MVSTGVVRFGTFRLDARSGELRREGRVVRLPPQASKLLLLLASSSGELVSREQIQKALWTDDTFVDFEHGINKCIAQVRAALGDDADEPRYVQTVARRGYRFLETIEKGEVEAIVSTVGTGSEEVKEERNGSTVAAAGRSRISWMLGAAAVVGGMVFVLTTLAGRRGDDTAGSLGEPQFTQPTSQAVTSCFPASRPREILSSTARRLRGKVTFTCNG